MGAGGCSRCGGNGGAAAGGIGYPPYLAQYPAMNREDALRYVEGFQYYPPYQLMRSPRDFYMFDVRYNLGK